jgi:hypothetical protein
MTGKTMSVLVFVLSAALASSGACGPSKAVTGGYIAKVTGKALKVSDNFIYYVKKADDMPGEIHVFARIRGKWRAYDSLLFDQEIVGAKSTPDGRHLIWGWHTSGDPGQSFDGVLYRPGQALRCPSVSMSPPANWDEKAGERAWAGEFLELIDFNIDASGKGALIAEGDIDREGQPLRETFVYKTVDGGQSWKMPVKISKVYKPKGIYR